MLDNTVAYPGVREALAELSGDSAAAPEHAARAMAVLTNKPVFFGRAILDGLGLARYFRFVYGGNSFERKKPDPMGVEALLRELRASPQEALMIGDSGRGYQDGAQCGDLCLRGELWIRAGGFAGASAGFDGGLFDGIGWASGWRRAGSVGGAITGFAAMILRFSRSEMRLRSADSPYREGRRD